MAYMNQDKKAKLSPKIKEVLAKHGVKATLSVNNHSTLICKLSSTSNETIFETLSKDKYINEYWIDTHFAHCPTTCKFLTELRDAMMIGNHNNSDIMTDYFDVGWYITIKVSEKFNLTFKML